MEQTVRHHRHVEQSRYKMPMVVALITIAALSSVSSAQVYDFKTYTVREGLLSNVITCLCQDSFGRLWIGTGDGLSVYDGEVFRNYTVADGLASSLVNCLIEDRIHKGVLWIGTNGGGVSRFESGSFRNIKLGNSDWTNRVNSIAEDRFGNVYCATDGGLFRIRRNRSDPIAKQISQAPCDQVIYDRDSLYFVGPKGEMLAFDGTGSTLSGRAKRIQTPFPVVKMFLDSKGDIWIASGRGDLLNMESGLHFQRALKSIPSSLTDDGFGNIWVGTSEGLYRIDKNPLRERSITLLTRSNGLSEDNLTSVLVDREGDVWAGTFDNGLTKLADKSTCELPLEYDYTATNSSQAASDWNGHIWVAARHGLTEIWGDGYGVLRECFHSYKKIGVTAGCAIVQIESGDRLWLATDDGFISCFRIENSEEGKSALVRIKSFSVNRIMPGLTPLCLYIDLEGRAWYSRDTAGVLELDVRKGLTGAKLYTMKDGLPDNSVRAICEDTQGNVWFGGYIGGLAELKKDRASDSMKLFTARDGLPDNSVRAIVEDDSGRIWIGTRYDGIALLKGEHLTRISVKQGLISDGIWSMAFDKKQGIFFGTESGLQRLVNDAMSGKSWQSLGNVTPVFSCGVTTSTPGSKIHQFLWGCTGSGIILTDLSLLDRVRVPPSVYVTGMLVNGSEVDIGSQLRLAYDMNTVTFHFAGISLKDEANLSYRYILDGADSRWTSVAGRLPVTYASLRPGKYRFKVIAINSDGIESSGIAAVSFTIVPPLWQRWWFILLSFAILISAVYLTVRSRVRRLLEIERVRSRIATDLHDDIGAGLTRIAILADVALRQAEVVGPRNDGTVASEPDADPESFSTRSVVKKIGSHARELVDSMSDVVWSIDPKNVRAHDLITRFRGFANDTCEAKGIRIDIDIDNNLETLRLDPGVTRTLLLIAKEALHNSVKHSGCKQVRVGIKADSKEMRFLVSDDGSGFNPGKSSTGHGLENMRMRAEKLGGVFKLRSSPGTGTVIEIAVPLAL